MVKQSSATIAARWIALGTGELMQDGWLEVSNGKIRAIEHRCGRRPDTDFGDAIILPGLVNAHTHLDLTGARELTPPRLPFPNWLREVIAYRRSRSPEHVCADIAAGIEQSFDAGTTLLGDISVGGQSWDALRASQLKAVVFHELIGLSHERAQTAVTAAQDWLATHTASPSLKLGLSPHSPYSFRFECLAQLNRFQVPIAMHVAESFDELELLMDHDGEFVEFLEEVGAWDPTGLPNLETTEHPLHEAKRLLMIHGNYLPAQLKVPTTATMVYCPRTHAAFEHPVHPFRGWLNNGVRVALGTDSLASNPDLSVLAEARFVAAANDDLDPWTLLDTVSKNGAYALGFEDSCGSIAAGLAADLCVIEVAANSGDPLRDVFFDNNAPIAVFSDSNRVR